MSLSFFKDKKVSLPYEFSAKTSASKHLVYVNASNAKKYIPLCVKDTYVNINGYKYTAAMPTVHCHDGTNHLVAVNSRSVITYTISYSMNGGTNPSSNPKTYTVETATITFTAPTKTGYNSGKFSPASIAKGSTGNKTVTASFTANTYKITYNGNSNTSGSVPNDTSCTYDSDVTFAGNTGSLARTGYTFSAWNTNSSGTGTSYSLNTKYTKPNLTATNGGKVNVYAKWVANTYKVVFNPNGATGGLTSKTTSQSCTYGKSFILNSLYSTSGNIVRGDYSLWRWATGSTYANRGTVYYPNQSVQNLTATNNGTVNLYAIFSKTITNSASITVKGTCSGAFTGYVWTEHKLEASVSVSKGTVSSWTVTIKWNNGKSTTLNNNTTSYSTGAYIGQDSLTINSISGSITFNDGKSYSFSSSNSQTAGWTIGGTTCTTSATASGSYTLYLP